MNHFLVMLIACILSGFASTMNMWIYKLDDFYFSLNDLYMTGLMTGWMFLFMGILQFDKKYFLFGFILTILSFYLIRSQSFVNEIQYLRGMIPHHSMAILMSKKLQNKPHTIQHLLDQIIQTQEKEIILMKTYLDH
jgi:peptidoglycan biosynthesis protein MviN/MurJ (putative lipid II flippase)